MTARTTGGPLKVHDAAGQVMGDWPGYAVLMPWGKLYRAIAFCYSGTALADAKEIARRWNAHEELRDALRDLLSAELADRNEWPSADGARRAVLLREIGRAELVARALLARLDGDA